MSFEKKQCPQDGDAQPEPQRTDVRIRLIPKRDRNDQVYHIARCEAPILLNLAECTIFVFTGDNPELSIRKTRTDRGQGGE